MLPVAMVYGGGMTGIMGVGRVGIRGVDIYRLSTCWQKSTLIEIYTPSG